MTKPSAKNTRSVEEQLIMSISIVMIITIIPFSIFRYINDQLLVASLELTGVLIMMAIGVYVWKTKKTKIPSIITSVFMMVGIVGLSYLVGSSILFWIYPIIITVYFLNSLKVSAIIVTPAILALIPILIDQKSITEICSILVTLGICQLCGYILSKKIRDQHSILKAMLNQDGLTRTFNRRAFDEHMSFLYNYSLRHPKEHESIASLILLDIDNFKSINDTYGHVEGDQILINLVELIKKNTRSIDLLYRYGGEEFAIIAANADALKATEIAEKVRKIIEQSQISKLTRVTASFGVTELQHLEATSKWIERTDEALYRAKRAGKNRVFIANKETQISDTERKVELAANN